MKTSLSTCWVNRRTPSRWELVAGMLAMLFVSLGMLNLIHSFVAMPTPIRVVWSLVMIIAGLALFVPRLVASAAMILALHAASGVFASVTLTDGPPTWPPLFVFVAVAIVGYAFRPSVMHRILFQEALERFVELENSREQGRFHAKV